ncbi:hypothetical protein AAHC03_0310 [Spirometra sp. Aus1]
MSQRDDSMDVSETIILPVSDLRIVHPLCTPHELIHQISCIAKNLQTVLESARPPPEDSFTVPSSPKLVDKDMCSALSLSCDGTPETTLSAEESTQPLSSLLPSDLPCCAATANPEPFTASVTPDDLSTVIRLKEFLKKLSSRSLADLAVSFQTFYDHFVTVDTERLLLEEECASLRAAANMPHPDDLNKTSVFEMLENVCVKAEDNIEELRASLKDARLQVVEFEAKVESLTLELSKQSASNTQLRSELLRTQELLQARTATLSDLENRSTALKEQVRDQEKRISCLDSAYEGTLEKLRAADARLLETKAENRTLNEQVRTLQDRLSDMGSELKETREQLNAANASLSNATVLLRDTATSIGLDQSASNFDLLRAINSWCDGLFQTYGWLRPSEHPLDIHHKFDPNTNPYKLLELREQKLADSRDFIDDLGVEIADLKKDRARLREQVDRLDAMCKRFEKEAADKNHQLQRYQDFFQKLFEPKRAAEFAEMVAMKFKKASSLHSSEGGSRTLSKDSTKKDSRLSVPQERTTPATSQAISPDGMARLSASNFQRPAPVSVRQTVPFPPSDFMEKENKQDGFTAQPHLSRSRQALLSINSNQWVADATSPTQHTVQTLKKPAEETVPKPMWDNKRLKLSELPPAPLATLPSDLTETPLQSARENSSGTSSRGGSWWGSAQTSKRGAEIWQTLKSETAPAHAKPSQLQPTLHVRNEQPGKRSGPGSTQSEDPGCATS